jgi:hypothetical protein
VRGATRRLLIRSLLDIRLSRFSAALLALVSALATAVILTSGDGRTPAQVAALAALRERPAVRQVVAQAPSTPARAPEAAGGGSSSPGSSGGGGGGDGGGGSSGSSSDTASSSNTGSSSTTSSVASDTSTTSTTTSTTPASTLPPVRHVFEIALSTSSYGAAFGHGSAAPYLRSLAGKGTLLSGYQSLGRGELADHLATVSGQAPNSDTAKGCATYTEFPQNTVAKTNGLVPGTGCVYPETALTIGDQASSNGDVWRAYIADMGTTSCTHPNSNAADDLALPGTQPGYDTRHNPFIYFHSLLDLGDCSTDDQALTKLTSALKQKSKTGAFSFIAPDACADATATPLIPPSTTTTGTTSSSSSSTATTQSSTTTTGTTGDTTSTEAGSTTPPPSGCPSGQAVGIDAENTFLKEWVPQILASPAYQDDGVLIIAFAGDGTKPAGHPARVGALVISGSATKGKRITTAYTPYSLLRSEEDMLGYDPLADAKSAPSFAQAVLHKTG